MEQKISEKLDTVMHPAIDLSLPKLGIIKSFKILEENRVLVVFGFPFPEIPIADQLFQMVFLALKDLGLEMRYQVEVMTEEERQKFLELEASAWKGL